MKTLSDSGPLVRLLSVRWQLPCNLLVNELPKMTHCWILLAPSGQLFRFWDTFAFSWCGRPRALAFPSSVFNFFPLLTMSPLLLQFLPSSCEKPRSFNLYYSQRLSHGIVSACWRLPAKAFATKNNTTTQPPRTILCCKPTKQQDIHTLAQNIQPTILPHYSHYQLELTLPTM